MSIIVELQDENRTLRVSQENGRQWNQLLELELTNLRAILTDGAADWKEDAKTWARKSQEHAKNQDQREADFCHGFASGLLAAAESLAGGGGAEQEANVETGESQSGAGSPSSVLNEPGSDK
jgi:hypothetical protein